MTKVKYLVLLLVSAMLILVLPNISNAATEYTYEDTEQGITWSYRLDEAETNVINIWCTTKTKTGAVTIPSTIDGKNVISLADDTWDDGAFEDCAGITEVTIPNTISVIGKFAFKNCTGLKTITIPDSVTTINNEAFKGCSGLTSVTFSNNLTTIGAKAFENCSGLKTITIPNSVSNIGERAFANCSGLREITLSESLTKISGGCFHKCTALKSVIIPNSVTTIEDGGIITYGAFEDCTNLEKILIPDSVATIEDGAFDGCDKLTIYGNDDQVSKDYAEANEIAFNYIENWDKETSGGDITPPEVKSLMVTYESVMKYNKDSNTNMYIVPVGAKIVINATFSEEIKGTTVPTLTIKFGDGENIEIKEGTITGSKIVYIYTIKETDKGVMAEVSLTGGDVTDEAGNAATLSCPKIYIQYDSVYKNDVVYANGTATNPDAGTDNDDGNNNNTEDGSNEGSNNTDNSTGEGSNDELNNGTGGNTNNGTTEKEESKNESTSTEKEETKNETNNDKTQATGKIPHAGVEIGIIIAIVSVAMACVIVYARYNKMRDIL